MDKPSLLILVLNVFLKMTLASSKMFTMTQNISEYQFNRVKKKTMKAASFIDCAGKCLYWENKYSYCNAFRSGLF